MNPYDELLLELITQVAKQAGFEDPTIAFWQCHAFSAAVVVLANELGVNWELYSMEIRYPDDISYLGNSTAQDLKGQTEGHTAILINNKIYDFTMRQFDPKSAWPHISTKANPIYSNRKVIKAELDEDSEFWYDKLKTIIIKASEKISS